MEIQCFRNFQRGLLLQRKNILQITREIVGPGLKTGARIDQLNVDAYLIPGFTDAAFKKIAHAQLTSDLRGRLVAAFKSRAGHARSHIHAPNLRELGGDFIGHAVAEIRAVRFGAEILQGKDPDGRARDGGPTAWGEVLSKPKQTSDQEQRSHGHTGDVAEAASSFPGIWNGGASQSRRKLLTAA